MADFDGDSFGQSSSLVPRLRELLSQYPAGTSTLREFLQNADDAGASRFVLSLDTQSYPATTPLLYPGLESGGALGPALLVYNDALFTPDDLAAIQRVGDSLKHAEASGKTGRWGLGFNSVYHVSDTPSLVSGSIVAWFDPQAKTLPVAPGALPGKMIDVSTARGAALTTAYPATFDPYRLAQFGCNPGGVTTGAPAMQGTLFRLPLRTPAVAATSQLSTRAVSVEDATRLLHEFAGEAAASLLFCKSLRTIEIWLGGGVSATVSLSSVTPAVLASRALAVTAAETAKGGKHPVPSLHDYTLDISTSVGAGGCGPHVVPGVATWLFCAQAGAEAGGALHSLSAGTATRHLRLLPVGGIAALVRGGTPPPGRVFVTQPLPILSGLPVHINARFETSSNRRSVWWEDGSLSGDGAARAAWNAALIEEILAPAYARLLRRATSASVLGDTPAALHALLPCLTAEPGAPSPWTKLMNAVFRVLVATHAPVLWVPAVAGCAVAAGIPLADLPTGSAASGYWCTLQAAVVLPHVEETENALVAALRLEGVPLVTLPSAQANAVVASGHCAAVADSKFVRARLRSSPTALVSVTCGGGSGWRLGLSLLRKCVQDLVRDAAGTTPVAAAKVFAELRGLPLLPLASGHFAKFEEPATGTVLFSRDPLVHRLLVGEVAGRCLVASTAALGGDLEALLASGPLQEAVNVAPLTHKAFARTLMGLAPKAHPGAAIPMPVEGLFSPPWLELAWSFLRESVPDLSPYVGVSLLPTRDGGISPLCLGPLLPPLDSWTLPERPPLSVLHGLAGAGIRFVEPATLRACVTLADLHPRLSSFVQPASLWGFAASCQAAAASMGETTRVSDLFVSITAPPAPPPAPKGGWLKAPVAPVAPAHPVSTPRFSPEQCDALRGWLAELARLAPAHLRPPTATAVLAALPVYRAYGASGLTPPRPLDCAPRLRLLREADALMHAVGRGEPGFALFSADALVYADAATLPLFDTLGEPFPLPLLDFVTSLLPRLARLPPPLVTKVMHWLLGRLDELRTSPDLVRTLSDTAFITPAVGSVLLRPRDAYDVSVDSLAALVDPSLFPSPAFAEPEQLAALRTLGLRVSLDRSSLLGVARSVETTVRGACAVTPVNEALLARGVAVASKLFSYIDGNAKTLFAVRPPPAPQVSAPPATQNLSSRVGGLFKAALVSFVDPQAEARAAVAAAAAAAAAQDLERKRAADEAAAAAFAHELRGLAWVPVWLRLPAGLPAHSPVDTLPVATPPNTRPFEDAALCSFTRRIFADGDGAALLAEVLGEGDGDKRPSTVSHAMRAFLGWDAPLPPAVLAQQLVAMGAQQQQGGESTSISFLLPRFFDPLLASAKGPAAEFGFVTDVLSAASAWIPCEGRFVPSSRVAFGGGRAAFSAPPFLFSVPHELLPYSVLLRACGVRETFSCSDFAVALRGLAARQTPPGSPLSPADLDLALVLVARAAPPNGVTTLDVLVPSVAGILLPACEVLFEDAAWADSGESQPKSEGEVAVFVHPSISNQVAASVGCISHRSRLLKTFAGVTPLGGGDLSNVVAFGLSEPIVSRIKSVLELYPEGPLLLNEYVANASDAGATVVRFCADLRSHKCVSLLDPRLSAWQGPALVVQNDALFSERDWASLSRVGQGHKLDMLATTGRFGLGALGAWLVALDPAAALDVFPPHPSNPLLSGVPLYGCALGRVWQHPRHAGSRCGIRARCYARRARLAH